MRVISIPFRLKMAVGLFFLTVPIGALETILVTRSHWWKLPYQSMGIWSAAVMLICIPLAVWLLQGKKWAFLLSAIFLSLWCLLSAWVSLRMQNPSLGFFTI